LINVLRVSLCFKKPVRRSKTRRPKLI
jgi:hypothetical protein